MKKRAQNKKQSKEMSVFGQFLAENPQANIRIVLDREELLESKQNVRLFGEYITKNQERFWDFLSFINIKDTQDSEKIPNKYPFIVSELFGSKDELMIDYFFDQKGPEEFEFLNYLFKIVDRDWIDDTLAGYFNKILKAIIDKRGLNLWKYLTNSQKESQYVLKDLIKHLDVYHIADVVFNLIRLDTNRQENENVYLDERIQLLHRIIEYLQQKSYNPQIVENASYILSSVLTETNEVEEKEIFIQKICNQRIQYKTFLESKSSNLIHLLINLLEHSQQDHKLVENRIAYSYYFIQELSFYLHVLLNQELYLTPYSTSFGTMQEPLGQFKLSLIEFYFRALKLNSSEIVSYFSHQDIFQSIMELIIKHEFNNAIQILFTDIVQLVMKNDEYQQIQQALLNANISQFLSYLNQYEKYQVGILKKLITKGFQGMANKLSYILQHDIEDENWKKYIQNQQQIFDNENNYLLGQNPNYYEENEENANQIIQSLTIQNTETQNDQNFNTITIQRQLGDCQLNQFEVKNNELEQPIRPIENFQQIQFINSPQTQNLLVNQDILRQENQNSQIEQQVQPEIVASPDIEQPDIPETSEIIQIEENTNNSKDPDKNDGFMLKMIKEALNKKADQNIEVFRNRRLTQSFCGENTKKVRPIQRKLSDHTQSEVPSFQKLECAPITKNSSFIIPYQKNKQEIDVQKTF